MFRGIQRSGDVIFFHVIHFELARFAAGTTVDRREKAIKKAIVRYFTKSGNLTESVATPSHTVKDSKPQRKANEPRNIPTVNSLKTSISSHTVKIRPRKTLVR